MEKLLKFTTHAAAAAEESRHWRSLSVAERVSAVELLREATGVYGDDPSPRLERVYRLVVVPPRALRDSRDVQVLREGTEED